MVSLFLCAAWYHVSSPHFELSTNTSVQRASKAIERLERSYGTLRDVAPVFYFQQTPADTKANVVIFKTGAELRSAGVTRVYSDHGLLLRTLFLADDDQNDERLLHELSHVVTSTFYPGAPEWLEEGLAEVISTSARNGDEVTTGNSTALVRTQHKEPRMPLDELLEVKNLQHEYLSATYLVHTLFTEPELRDALPELLAHFDKADAWFTPERRALIGPSYESTAVPQWATSTTLGAPVVFYTLGPVALSADESEAMLALHGKTRPYAFTRKPSTPEVAFWQWALGTHTPEALQALLREPQPDWRTLVAATVELDLLADRELLTRARAGLAVAPETSNTLAARARLASDPWPDLRVCLQREPTAYECLVQALVSSLGSDSAVNYARTLVSNYAHRQSEGPAFEIARTGAVPCAVYDAGVRRVLMSGADAVFDACRGKEGEARVDVDLATNAQGKLGTRTASTSERAKCTTGQLRRLQVPAREGCAFTRSQPIGF